MRSEFKKQWIEALRDPKTKQGQGVLEKLSGFQCCLGVALNILNVPKEKDKDIDAYVFGRCYAFPNDDHLKMIGITYSQASTLANMNDDCFSFQEIAQYIEDRIPVNE